MADTQALYNALRKADAAGDTAGAARIAAYIRSQQTAPKPKSNSRTEAVALGAIKPIDNLASLAADIPVVGPAIDQLGQRLGMPSTASSVASHDAARANNSRTGYQTIGNIVGTLPTAALKGGAAVQGAASGAILSDKKNATGVATDALTGAVTSLGVDKGLKLIGNLAAPVVNKGVKALHDAGVPLTLGQLAGATGTFGGKVVKGIEDAATSLPFVGDLINNARDRGTVAYNRAVLSRALAPLNLKIPDKVQAGHEMVRYVGDKLSAAYTALTPKLKATVDQDFARSLASARAATKTLPTATQKQFGEIVKDALGNRVVGMQFSGQALKDAETKLSALATRYGKSLDVDQQRMGDAIGEVLSGFRDMVARANPQHAAELKALNKGWRELSIAEKAGGGPGNATGVFTPKQYAAASRASDGSVRKRATARGTVANQVLNDAAASMLPNQIPDSGTARRAVQALLVGGGGTAAVGALTPTTAATGLLLAAPYTRGGQRVVNSIFAGSRPAAVRKGGMLLKDFARYAPQVTPALLNGRDK